MTAVVESSAAGAPTEHGIRSPVRVEPGPRLLAHLADGPGLDAHRARFGDLPRLSAWLLAELAQRAELRGRGGAGFPFARKLNAVAEGRRPVVVLNAAEGEPASAKDQTLAVHAPHRVLDGVALAASALGTREVHLVAPTERTPVVESLRRAVAERRAAGERLRWRTHLAAPGFVSGQARAVVELISGRPGLPVTSWQPEAISGYRNRPTLLSNAETFAQLATLVHLGAEAYAATGTPDEPGTVLLSITVNRSRQVLEVPFGTPWDRVLPPDTLERPLITGGYHGTWASAGQLRHLTVSRAELASHGLALGAGVVIVTSDDDCPVRLTARICEFLAASSARRCGPCLNGLPALSGTLDRLAAATDGEAAMTRVQQLMAMVERRGACAHPDGVVRLVRSLFEACSDEVAAHLRGTCLRPGPARA